MSQRNIKDPMKMSKGKLAKLAKLKQRAVARIQHEDALRKAQGSPTEGVHKDPTRTSGDIN